MKKIFLILSLIFILMLTGCSSKAETAKEETLEEKLLANTWSMSQANGTAVSMTFYENNTAVSGENTILSKSFDWTVNDEEITLIQATKHTTITMIFSVEEDSSGTGFILSLSDISTEPVFAYYSSQYSKIYSQVKLTPEK